MSILRGVPVPWFSTLVIGKYFQCDFEKPNTNFTQKIKADFTKEQIVYSCHSFKLSIIKWNSDWRFSAEIRRSPG